MYFIIMTLEALSLSLSIIKLTNKNTDKSHDGGPEFAQVFVIIWVGAAVVTLNSKLLDGKL